MRITIEDNGTIVSVEKPAINLTDALELMENALRGVGFNFKGRLEIVEDE